ncbi:MAG: tetratricopeptide repeat protein, partial [Casimicrobiaceae bacterium]
MFTSLKALFPTKADRLADESRADKKLGDEHMKHERLDEAAQLYRRALGKDPLNADACVTLGYVLAEQRQYREAEKYLGQALALDGGLADAHFILGTIAKNENDRAGCIRHFTRAVETKPDFEFAYHELLAALVEDGQTQVAKNVLGRAIAAQPASAAFHNYLGGLLANEGANGDAIACYRKALSITPGAVAVHYNLAEALRKNGQLEEATPTFRKALWFDPDFVDAHVGLGAVMQSQEKWVEAVACYQRAVELKPGFAAAHVSLGTALEGQGRTDEAIASYKSAIALDPNLAAAHQNLGNALLKQGARPDAIASYERVLKIDAESPVKHLIQALSGQESERAPSEYVAKLFDEYAQHFDQHLVGKLNYKTPEKLSDILLPHTIQGGTKWTVLDLGCGTGLSGVAIASFAGAIVGVDLSAKMLEKAQERKLYSRLVNLDLVTMMRSEAAASYDLVLAADVFVYLGKLDELAEQARRLLRPGGLFAFSVESIEALADAAARHSEL